MQPGSRPFKITANVADVDLRAPGGGQVSRYIIVGGDGDLVFVPATNAEGETAGAVVSWPVVAGDMIPVEARAIDSTNTALPLLVLY